MGRRRDRTFTGCSKCRARKVKCDEAKPGCLACRRLGVQCPGYGATFIWVDSQDDEQSYQSNGRRALQIEMTWKGFPTLDSDVIDCLIAECDPEGVRERAQPTWSPSHYSPFSVFPLTRERKRELGQALTAVPRSPASLPDLPEQERFLFHHYVTHVGALMLPYQHRRNPWQSDYPVVAIQNSSIEHEALYRALLAHSAFNLAQLRGQDEILWKSAAIHYNSAIQQLLPQLSCETNDFSYLLASIMALMFAEIYSGTSRNWWHHVRGAWKLLEKYQESEPWRLTDLAGVSLQSLRIIRIVGETSRLDDTHDETGCIDEEPNTSVVLATSISSTPEFGFTIGAPRSILFCIAQITDFRRNMEPQSSRDLADDLLQEILSTLNCCRRSFDDAEFRGSPKLQDVEDLALIKSRTQTPPEETSQAKAFLYATYIYLYRSVLDVPPISVRQYVVNTFEEVDLFFASCSGNFSIWPAFIAAAEAYTEEDLTRARTWLDCALSFGIGSRKALGRVLEEVWRRRDKQAREADLDRGLVIVDWRQIMRELNCDVLIV